MSKRSAVPIAKPQQSRAALVKDTLRAPGRELSEGTRNSMEQRFGYDFSGVRIHNDDAAAESAAALRARAYTSGNHIVFGAGQYSPHAGAGEQLLAHELAHVVQQQSGPVQGSKQPDGLRLSDRSDRYEQQARLAAREPGRMAAPAPSQGAAPDSSTIQRDDASSVVGAIAGVASGILAIGALAVAAEPPTGAPPTGGVTINHLTQLSTQQNPGDSEGESTLVEVPALRVSLSEASHATISLFLRTDGTDIIEAYTEEKQVAGFGGGSHGDNLVVNFRGSATGRQAGAPAPPAATQKTPKPARPKEAAILVNGIVNKGGSQFLGISTHSAQTARFRGRYQVFGNGQMKADAEITSAVGATVSAISTAQIPRPASPSDPPYIEIAFSNAPTAASQGAHSGGGPQAASPGGGAAGAGGSR